MRNSSRAVGKAIADAYKNTVAKMIMDFGDYLSPIYEGYSDAVYPIQVNDTCNEDCAVKCFNPQKADVLNSQWVFGFNKTCFRKCGCQFLFESWDNATRQEYINDMNDLNGSFNSLNKFLKGLGDEAKKMVKPKVDDYIKKRAELQDEFNQLVTDVATSDLGCNSTCVARCANRYSDFWNTAACISNCQCDIENIIDVQQGTYNYSELVLYSQGDVKRWNLFKKFENSL